MLLITHRPEGLDQVDQIVRLADGRITPNDARRPDREPRVYGPPGGAVPQAG